MVNKTRLWILKNVNGMVGGEYQIVANIYIWNLKKEISWLRWCRIYFLSDQANKEVSEASSSELGKSILKADRSILIGLTGKLNLW